MRKGSHWALATLAGAVLLTACGQQRTESSSGSRAADAASAEARSEAEAWLGKKAPPFALPGIDGKTVDLAKIIGTRPVVLVFYRGVW